ncbi:hypothetical protein [Methylomagnum sp.]
MPEKQAEALSEVLEVNWKELATKEDLARMEERMNNKIELLRAELKREMSDTRGGLQKEIADTKADLTRWILAQASCKHPPGRPDDEAGALALITYPPSQTPPHHPIPNTSPRATNGKRFPAGSKNACSKGTSKLSSQ